MATVSFLYINSGTGPVTLQVDPWANPYCLDVGEEIEIVAESESDTPEFWLREHGAETRILTICHSTEYFVMRDGRRLHWRDLPSLGFE